MYHMSLHFHLFEHIQEEELIQFVKAKGWEGERVREKKITGKYLIYPMKYTLGELKWVFPRFPMIQIMKQKVK